MTCQQCRDSFCPGCDDPNVCLDCPEGDCDCGFEDSEPDFEQMARDRGIR